jgi:hypothetical protein
MNKNRNLWIAFGVVIVLCICISIGGFLVLNRLGPSLMESVKVDPDGAEQVGAKIAEYTLPDGYTHQMGMSILGYDFVIIGPQEGTTNGMIIMLAQFSQSYMQGADPQTFQQQMQRSLEQQSGRRGLEMKVVETKTMTIHGEQAEVLIMEGTDENGTSMRQLITNFSTDTGLAMVMIQSLTEAWDQAAVDSFLESIR